MATGAQETECVCGVRLALPRPAAGRDASSSSAGPPDGGAERDGGEVEIDPYFFDEGYTVAGSTGFFLWEGGRRMASQIGQLLRERGCLAGARVLELGAGTGLVGIAAARLGARVILTDLPAVVEGSIEGNVRLNEDPAAPGEGERRGGWHSVGAGSCRAAALDWEKDLEASMAAAGLGPAAAWDLDAVVSAESVWLKELVGPFARTFAGLLRAERPGRGGRRAVGLMCVRDRTTAASKCFARPQELVDELRRLGGAARLLSEESSAEEGGKSVLVYEVRCVAGEEGAGPDVR